MVLVRGKEVAWVFVPPFKNIALCHFHSFLPSFNNREDIHKVIPLLIGHHASNPLSASKGWYLQSNEILLICIQKMLETQV
jgi:hypothetical protein